MPDIESLEIVAGWREDLTIRLRRAQMRFELVGLEHEEQDKLAAEVSDFKRTCRAVAWLSKADVEITSAEAEAA